MNCDHKICKVASNRGKTAACSLVVDLSKNKVVLGYERTGRNKGKFNLCCGSIEDKDNGCYVKCAERELMEEFKMVFGEAKKITAKYDFIIPVFIVEFDSVDVDSLNEKLIADIENYKLPDYMKEIDHLMYFPKNCISRTITSLARSALRRYL